LGGSTPCFVNRECYPPISFTDSSSRFSCLSKVTTVSLQSHGMKLNLNTANTVSEDVDSDLKSLRRGGGTASDPSLRTSNLGYSRLKAEP